MFNHAIYQELVIKTMNLMLKKCFSGFIATSNPLFTYHFKPY